MNRERLSWKMRKVYRGGIYRLGKVRVTRPGKPESPFSDDKVLSGVLAVSSVINFDDNLVRQRFIGVGVI